MQFADDGYLVLRDVVPANVWQPAAASVFGALGQPGAVIHGGDGSNSGHPAAGKLGKCIGSFFIIFNNVKGHLLFLMARKVGSLL